MEAIAIEESLRHFLVMKDPRRHNVRHLFTDILTIAILAVMSKSDDWTDVVEWARAQVGWLKTFLSLPHGIPSADTFGRVFARIDPLGFERCFINWTTSLAGTLQGKLINIDGKTLRKSFEHAWAKHNALHLVSAWCMENELVLGQVAVREKSNEITAIPALLGMLNVKGATITIDAMGCQREIAAKIIEKQADYVLAVKDNQPLLYEKVKALSDLAVLEHSKGGMELPHGYHEQTDGEHGRIETRKVWATDDVAFLGEELLGKWPGLSSVAVVQSTRQDLGDLTGKVSVECRYFISSVKGCDADKMGQMVRGHWNVENQLHWRLDVSFGEDASRIRTGNGAENFSRLRRVVLNKLKSDPRKVSLKTKRYRCSMDTDYLIERLKS